METLGFIILRHVNNKKTNEYWIESVKCIRKLYPENKILIIDDNSNYNFITNPFPDTYNITVINSEHPKRGELLPYYYYLHNKLFDVAIIIHDSVLIKKHLDLSFHRYKFLWSFESHVCKAQTIGDETTLINAFNDSELKKFHETRTLWDGCFGAMSLITHDYLVNINKKYDISKLIPLITCRKHRQGFERVFACILQIEKGKKNSLLGNIHKYCDWGLRYENRENYPSLPYFKHWTGR